MTRQSIRSVRILIVSCASQIRRFWFQVYEPGFERNARQTGGKPPAPIPWYGCGTARVMRFHFSHPSPFVGGRAVLPPAKVRMVPRWKKGQLEQRRKKRHPRHDLAHGAEARQEVRLQQSQPRKAWGRRAKTLTEARVYCRRQDMMLRSKEKTWSMGKSRPYRNMEEM